MNVLVIGAHADDVELAMLGTIQKHIEQGDEVHQIIATDSSKLGDVDIRKQDSLICAKKVGIKSVSFLNLRDTMLDPNGITIEKLEKEIGRVKPDMIYTHSVMDTHQDHRNLSYATLTAARHVPTILFYETPSSQIGFIPNYFVNIERYINQKIILLRNFKGGIEKKWYMEVEAIKGTAVSRGYQSKLKYAEAFQIFRAVDN